MKTTAPTFVSRMTTAFVAVLTALAALAVVGFWLPQRELRIQQTSAAVLNLTGHQSVWLEHAALLAQSLATTTDGAEREKLRADLRETIERITSKHQALTAGDSTLNLPRPPATVHAMYFEPPLRLNEGMRRYLEHLNALVADDSASLTADDAHLRHLLREPFRELSRGLDAVTTEYQRLHEAGIRRLRAMANTTLTLTLGALLLSGVLIFRPLVRRVQREHEERLCSERLAVIGTMAAKFAHEIRNPLGSIRLNLDSVREEMGANNGAVVPELLGAIDSEVHRIERISDGYLQFARLPKAAKKPLALNEWLARQLRFCAAELEQRHIRLNTEFEADLPIIQADPGQLWQAVLNVVRNAWEVMPDGGTLTVRTLRARRQVWLEIADSGPGMTEEQRRAVFQPFFTAKEGGTGLGLALTQQIIAEHGGQIECQARLGGGTSFLFRLPLEQENHHEPPINHSRRG